VAALVELPVSPGDLAEKNAVQGDKIKEVGGAHLISPDSTTYSTTHSTTHTAPHTSPHRQHLTDSTTQTAPHRQHLREWLALCEIIFAAALVCGVHPNITIVLLHP
jgi:hypothetical protein